ncbi:MAG: hypothetical protein METHP_01896 [Methanoregula sp. SKADARSKE-2]|nr:MAG: hypothetical protein METHP_01273 [Methanoregula sp. SKADARSKE-2]WML67899.1 MAG: hypothetical protein METHP_01467 [Methanoregula sp. SKADARSKE-2]WML68289.1 MAG: hypothetical protein METHP_01896 [Methanoregula sp. SKADARSKE-2]
MDLQAFDKNRSFLRRKRLIKCSNRVGVQVIADKNYFSGVWVINLK